MTAPSTLYKEEKQLIGACVKGDADSWSRFVDAYGRLIRATAGRVIQRSGNPLSEVEDVVSHVYEKLLDNDCRRLGAWRAKAKFSTYLVQVVRNLTLDYKAKDYRRERVEQRTEYPQWIDERSLHADRDEDREMSAALKKAMGELSPDRALIIHLRLEGKSLREIAQITNRPQGTIAVENSRALEKMRKVLRTAIQSRKAADTQGGNA